MSQDQVQLEEIDRLLAATPDRREGLQKVMQYLHDQRSDYHWVGIYELKGEILHLGPYVGPETDHAEIPVGRGVCGTAVAEDRNQIVDDVRALTNYLACNLETRSEIVVLIRDPATGRVRGQIDVDGTKVKSFGKAEEAFLEQVAARLAPHLG
jgi:GAF domain-containing protein